MLKLKKHKKASKTSKKDLETLRGVVLNTTWCSVSNRQQTDIYM